MKKLLAIFLSVFILASAASNVFAQANASLKEIKYAKSGSQDKISLFTANFKGFNAFYMAGPDRLVVDIPNNLLAVKGSGTISVNSTMIKSIRFSQFTKSAVRVVFDLKGKQPYTVQQASGCLTFVFGKASAPAATTPETSRGGDVERPPVAVNRLSYNSEETVDKIIVPGGNHAGYTSTRLTDPDRIVVDVPNCTVPADQSQIPGGNTGLVKNILYTQLDANTARIVAETNGQLQYRLTTEQDQLVLSVESPTYRNITYTTEDETATLTLKGVRLEEMGVAGSTSGGVDGTEEESAFHIPLYSGITDPSGKLYTFSFPTSLADIGSGILQINDAMLKSVEIVNDVENRTTCIFFTSSDPRVYDVVYNPKTNDTEIHILKSFTKTDKLVVIDAGHGGSDPGATYAGIKEKDLNLKIALKVNDILKNKGINTYLTRSDDTFIPLYDRANIANDSNAALFLSIHNNAFNMSENGTETLCYPSDKSRQFASIVQKNLISTLGTKDRGIINRPNLVVLHATKMPAALAEIAYITNDGDRKKLQDEQFLDKAAAALADSIMEALETMT